MSHTIENKVFTPGQLGGTPILKAWHGEPQHGAHPRKIRHQALIPGDTSHMAIINQDDFIRSVADALQYISFYHPVDYITNLARAYEMEQGPAAKDAIAQILINSRMCAEGHRPICQDTGIVTAFVKVGMEVKWQPGIAGMMTMQEMVDEGVREAWRNADNVLRPSILEDPAFTRRNTGDNTPAMVVVELVEGGEVDVI